jgi:hypothetical protein
MLHTLDQIPCVAGQTRGRWTLAMLLENCKWLRLHTLPGLCQVLARLKIHWKRARWHVHSPDPDYVKKLREIYVQIQKIPVELEQSVFLFQDEFTLYRHPGLAQGYTQAGKAQILAELGYKANYTWRIAAGLNVWTGQVSYYQARVMDVTRMIIFYRKLHQAYPQTIIFMGQDNWPLHYHPDVIATLQPQAFPYGLRVPPRWSKDPSRPIPPTLLPIHLLFLPIYASWTNPIEKLWRLLHHEVLHLHRYADDWPALKQRVWAFLDQFKNGSPDLLRYVGLRDPKLLYKSLFPA